MPRIEWIIGIEWSVLMSVEWSRSGGTAVELLLQLLVVVLQLPLLLLLLELLSLLQLLSLLPLLLLLQRQQWWNHSSRRCSLLVVVGHVTGRVTTARKRTSGEVGNHFRHVFGRMVAWWWYTGSAGC